MVIGGTQRLRIPRRGTLQRSATTPGLTRRSTRTSRTVCHECCRAESGRGGLGSGELTMTTHAQAQSSQRHNIDPHEAHPFVCSLTLALSCSQSCFRPRRFCTGERKGRCDFEIGRRQRLVTQPRTTDAENACGHPHVGTKDAIQSPERGCEAGSRGGSRLWGWRAGPASTYRHRPQEHPIQEATLD